MKIAKRKASFIFCLRVLLGVLILVNFGVCLNGEAATSAEGKGGLMKLGDTAPDFKLPDVVTGEEVTLGNFKDDKALLVAVICRHCPFVQHVKKELARLGRDYQGKGLAIVAISANDPAGYPEDAPGKLKEMTDRKFLFPMGVE